MSAIDFNGLLLRAEHEISYSAKRAIEMYIPVYEKGPAINLFEKCAEHYHLLPGQVEQCKLLMLAAGMKDYSDDWANLILSYGPKSDLEADRNGYKLIGGGRDENGKEVHVFQRWDVAEGRKPLVKD